MLPLSILSSLKEHAVSLKGTWSSGKGRRPHTGKDVGGTPDEGRRRSKIRSAPNVLAGPPSPAAPEKLDLWEPTGKWCSDTTGLPRRSARVGCRRERRGQDRGVWMGRRGGRYGRKRGLEQAWVASKENCHPRGPYGNQGRTGPQISGVLSSGKPGTSSFRKMGETVGALWARRAATAGKHWPCHLPDL